MADTKDVFQADVFAAKVFAGGVFRGSGVAQEIPYIETGSGWSAGADVARQYMAGSNVASDYVAGAVATRGG